MDHLQYDTNIPELEFNEENGSTKRSRHALDENQEAPVLLDPDHPLMQKFQTTYKECLEKENERVYSEIIELKSHLKKKKQEFEYEMSNEMYNLEQEVLQQRKTIDEYESAISNAVKLRTEKEEYAKVCRDTYRDQLEKLNVEKKKDIELLGELEALSLLCKQFEAWQKETDAELAVNQRISEKLSVEKKQLSQEKRKYDLMVYKLTTEVWNLEAQTRLLDDQIKIKSEELEAMKNKSTDNYTDLEMHSIEQKRLIQLWNTVLLNIQKKDTAYTEINNELENIQSEIKTFCTKIELCEKNISDEMRKNEIATAHKDKTMYRLAECDKLVENEQIKKTNLEAILMETTTILEMTEKDLNRVKMENKQKREAMDNVRAQFEKCVDEKTKLENETLDRLQQKLTFDKTATSLAKIIKELKDSSRQQEMSMLKSENKLAKILLKIERQKNSNAQKKISLEEEKKLHDEKQSEVTMMENNIKEYMMSVSKTLHNIDVAKKKLRSILEKAEGGMEISPIERKIKQVETAIAEYTSQSKELQQKWLQTQERIVKYTKQYQTLESENALLHQKIEILECKLTKLDNSINAQKQEAVLMQRSLDSLQTRVDQLSKQIYRDKEWNQELEEKYNVLTLEYTAKLKDAEIHVKMLEEEITDIEEEKVQAAIDIKRLKREVLSWQKMGIMVAETKHKIEEEKSVTGVVGRMKTEIHRMQVRERQVNATAAKLATDLAQSVWRRAAATNRARACPQSLSTRHTFVGKIKEKKNDIKRITQENEGNLRAIESMLKQKEESLECIRELKESLFEIRTEIDDTQKQIEDCQLLKQKNLEKIIRNQRYSQHCSAILSGQTRIHSVKSEPSISNEHDKQKKINSQLVSFVHKLLQDMPEHYLQLMRIINTLNIHDDH